MFGLYIHVPFCATRCGYCDFNTYTPTEAETSHEQYLRALGRELELAEIGPADTVFIGGGTPSLLGADGLGRIMDMVREHVGLRPGAEVTTESNPESTSPAYFEGLLEAGFTRISLGMQSASAPVLRVLERAHTPGRAAAAAGEALAAGFGHVNLDMIYGTPTETDDDVRATLDAILATGVDHVSAYSLIVEDGTAMARKIRRGELPAPREEAYASRYELIASTLADAGFGWYEVSNWARPGGECEHNLIYWRGGSWWGAGPGAHSTLGTRRFFNVKRPERYAAALERGELPIGGEETLTAADLEFERIMLGLRLREGVPREWIPAAAEGVVDKHAKGGLLTVGERVTVTDAGRLLVDGIVTDILAAE
ncbi:radical SAM family heme chaperone HemW [Corynebacterium liangguodongii]|uniref:Heme chaperone HemW n=1 Tax=Corynebacterium liangguodongii TaxID=2079535 RepID=A0A2S0WFE4_9CORY|nr:radical SAM family heme chaperone HemW [Corynebacterium liangguodongii]AWB84470.1 coproporphyrinogen III oxidase [Corynebacterium liangguodongii]PWB98599.1 coproporphyrinogen III oxidase [Corynebacterium liangguodongii]